MKTTEHLALMPGQMYRCGCNRFATFFVRCACGGAIMACVEHEQAAKEARTQCSHPKP